MGLLVAGWLAACPETNQVDAAEPATLGAVAAKPQLWPRRALTIPYRWTGKDQTTEEVVLFYSADLGRSWRRAGSAAPHVRAFAFTAPEDGEYWFAIRAFDRSGRATPPTPLGGEMRVAIDTAPPKVDPIAAVFESGRIVGKVEASDANGFGADPVTLYVRADTEPSWRPITVVPGQTSAPTAVAATATWAPPRGAKRVELRATVVDAAGNREEASTTVDVVERPTPIAAQPPSWGGALVGHQPGARSTTRPSPPWSAFTGSDPFVVAERGSVASLPRSAPPSSSPPTTPVRPAEATPWPSESEVSIPLADAPRGDSSPFRSAGFRRSNPLGSAGADGGFGVDGLPQTPQRIVNSAEFEFEYELEDAGRWGVAKVELWGTDDGGRSWRRYAIDSDRQSPIRVATRGEGRYGFRLVVEPVGGLAPNPPRPGDQPEAIVTVDLRAPHTTIRSAGQGEGYFADQLSIEWRVDDEHLAEQPISLSYSNRATGPWVPIATGLANSGRHNWRLQRHLPRRLYVRVEARDRAGNTGVAVTDAPIAIDVPTATGSLLGVRPR